MFSSKATGWRDVHLGKEALMSGLEREQADGGMKFPPLQPKRKDRDGERARGKCQVPKTNGEPLKGIIKKEGKDRKN